MMRADRENRLWLRHGVRQPASGSPTVGVDVAIGPRARARLMAAGYRVVMAHRSEEDERWFRRAVSLGAKLVISADADLVELANGTVIQVFQPRRGESDMATVGRFLRAHPLPAAGP